MRKKEKENSQFSEFNAMELYCPNCKKSVPVYEKLLLILPEGDYYGYFCRICHASLGSKIDKHKKEVHLIF